MKFLFITLFACSTSAFAETISKKEYVVNGVTYIEEVKKEKNGTSTIRYAKPGQVKQVTTTTVDAKKNVTTTTTVKDPDVELKFSVKQSPEEIKKNEKITAEYQSAVIECKNYENSFPHPFNPSETIKIKIWGLVNGKCKVTQTMPKNEVQTCLFTAEHRNALKKNFQTSQMEFFEDEKICEFTKNGKKIETGVWHRDDSK